MKAIFSYYKYLCSSISLILLAFMPVKVNAQYSIAEHILINEGLSNNFVHDLTLDNKGRLWVATESGLYSYNGISFDGYNMSNTMLNANMINCLWYDVQDNLLWIGTKGQGLCCVDPDTRVFKTFLSGDNTLSNISCITPATGRSLWVISPNEILRFDISKNSFSPIGINDARLNFYCGVDDGNGNLIIGTHMQGAYVYNTRTGLFQPLITNVSEDERFNVNEIHKDKFGRIWVGTSVGLWFYQPGSTLLIPFEQAGQDEIIDIEEADDYSLWITTRNSVRIIDLNTGEVSPLQISGEIKLFDDIQVIYHDPHGNIWIGGNGNGIEFISHSSPYFQKIHGAPFWGIFSEGGITWAGTRNHVLGFNGSKCICDYNISQQGQNYGNIISINGDGNDLLFLAVPYHFLTLNKKTGKISSITTHEGKEVEAITFYRDELGILWITTSDGIYYLKEGYAVECKPINEAMNHLSAHGIRRDKQGKYWVGTYENGVYVFDKDFKLLFNYSQQTGFFTNSIQHLRFDLHNRLWMSTPDGPCCIPDTQFPEQYVKFGYPEGLSDTYIRAIIEDLNGIIWMSTNSGISKLNFEEGSFVNYSQTDYVPVKNMNGGAVLQNDGGLVFTSMDGLCLCYPDSFLTERNPLKVNLLSVQTIEANDRGVEQNIVLPDKNGVYHLNPDQKSFRIYFGASDYANSRLLEYEYMTNGSKQGWNPCSRGAVTFRNLSSDVYNIKVRTRLKGQPWSEQNIITTIINIHHPWWWTIWARIFYALVILVVIFMSIKLYLHRLKLASELELEKKKNIVEHEQNGERLQFFTNITHELKTPLTLIQGPLEELLNDAHLEPSVQKRIQLVYDSSCRLTDLCNKLLEFRKSETNNHFLKVKKCRIGDLVKEVGQSFAELNSNPMLNIIVEIEEVQDEIFFDADVIRSILTNLLSNAIKYTPKGEIRLLQSQCAKNGRMQTIITVSDTGYGMPASTLPHIFDRYYQVKGPHQASGTGIGLSIVKSLAELHLAKIDVESKEGEGSSFHITLDNSQTYPDAMHVETVVHNDTEETSIIDEKDKRPIILLVEDDYQILTFMADALSNEYQILRAHNGQEGLEQAIKHIPDIVITDLMMPVMDGNILCRTLKNDLRTSHIPVIMLTAKDTQEDHIAGYADGADSYLTKPFSLTMLRTRLENILSARSRMIVWFSKQALPSKNDGADIINNSTVEDSVPAMSTYDKNFLRDTKAYIIEHIGTENIRMEDLAASLNMSHSTLYRKIKALTGLSGAEYIRKIRILHSAELMREKHCNVSEAAYRCGFSSLAYFRSAFKETFGTTPSEYLKQ